MKKIYTTPAVRHIAVQYRNSLLTIGIGSLRVNSYIDGDRTSVGGDATTSRMTVGGDLEDESDESASGRRTLWDIE